MITISRLEISTLVEKQHDNVKRTIESMERDGVIDRPQIEEIKTATQTSQSLHDLKRFWCRVVPCHLSATF
jgi:phage regulator Rha-like protein